MRVNNLAISKYLFSGIFFPNFFFLIVCITTAIASPHHLVAMDWPGQGTVMVRNFGWNDRGQPVLGTVFEGHGQALAAEDGELLFYNSPASGGLPSPLGAWAAVDHGDGLISIYSRLDPSSAGPPQQLEKGSPVAATGISGWARDEGFYFVLFDRHGRRWVNPSLIITPLRDIRAPQINSVELRDMRGEQSAAVGVKSLAQGKYTIIVNAVDTMLSPREVPLAPFKIICSVNGTESGTLSLETISASNGQLVVDTGGSVSAAQIFAPYPAYRAGEVQLNRGQATIEVIVQDIAGNSRSSVLRLQVE